MQSAQSVKRRIKATDSTAKITKAMEVVSATKMRRSQETALSSRPYTIAALALLGELSRRVSHLPAIMAQREARRVLVLVVVSDKGLAGSFNSAVFRRFEKEFAAVLHPSARKDQFFFVAAGRKAEEFLSRKGLRVERSFTKMGDYASPAETKPLADFIVRGFLEEQWDKVTVLSMHFRTTLKQEVIVRDVLPITYESISRTIKEIVPEYGRYADAGAPAGRVAGAEDVRFEYLIEPSPDAILRDLAEHLLQTSLYHLILEANASEHSARMVAMKNASDNALQLKEDLNLLYNKSRQAGITREISEISAGAESLKQ